MRIGVPCEIKVKENRVSCTPGGVRMLVQAGHEVSVQKDAGQGSGFDNIQYSQNGARIVPTAEDCWDVDLVMKVKEPIEPEYGYLRHGLILFTYLHLAAEKNLTQKLVETKTTAIAYETIQIGRRLPLLEPMSEIAGRMSGVIGPYYLSKAQGGKGVLLSGVPGVLPGRVLVLGGGIAGVNAAKVLTGLGATVIILEVDIEKMRFLDSTLSCGTYTLCSNEQNILELLPTVDLLIGTVLIPGARAPKLIKRNMLKMMNPGSVFVDVSIDQGGCAETSHPPTHENPVYVAENIVHYCVTNIPGAYARTATQALTNVTLPYLLKLADLGFEKAIFKIPGLLSGVNTHDGLVTNKAVAEENGYPFKDLSQ